MAIRRYQRRSVGRPPALPSMPAGFAQQDQGLQQVGQALRGFAEEMQARQQAERRVQAERQLSEFQVQEAERLADLETRRGELSRIDEQYREGFQERRQALLSGFDDPETRQFADRQLNQTYLRNQLSAMRIERDRNREATEEDLTVTVNNLANDLRSHPNRLAEHQESMMRTVSESGDVLSPEQQREAVRKANDQLVFSSVNGRIEQDPYGAKELIDSGRFDQQIQPGTKEKLLNGADQEIKRREAEARRIRNEQLRSAETLLNGAGDNMAKLLPPSGIEEAREIGRDLGGPEGEAVVARADQMEQYAGAATEFIALPDAQREQTKATLLANIWSGDADPQATELYTVLDDVDRRYDSLVSNEGSPAALASTGQIDELPPVDWSDSDSIANRAHVYDVAVEVQGPEAAEPFTESEYEQMDQAFGQGTEQELLPLMRGLNALPQGAREKAVSRLDDGSPAMALAVDAARDNPTLAMEVVRGQRAYEQLPEGRPSVEDVQTALRGDRMSALGGNVSQQRRVLDATKALYVNRKGGTLPKAMDISDLESAYDDVVGEPLSMNGSTFAPPMPGVSSSEFKGFWRRRSEFENGWGGLPHTMAPDGTWQSTDTPRYEDGTPVPIDDILADGEFRYVAPGTYAVTVLGGALQDSQGNRVFVRMKDPMQDYIRLRLGGQERSRPTDTNGDETSTLRNGTGGVDVPAPQGAP